MSQVICFKGYLVTVMRAKGGESEEETVGEGALRDLHNCTPFPIAVMYSTTLTAAPPNKVKQNRLVISHSSTEPAT